MKTPYPEIRAKISNKVDVVIRATQSDINLDEPFYAINWFSTKVEWLYHFYNYLAIKSVKKVGGYGFFKAEVTETIFDDMKGRRELILIVRYPGGQQFKSLMQSTYFKVVSIFRVISVNKFTFGFTHKLASDPESRVENGLEYAIHHFKSDKNKDEILKNVQDILPDHIFIKYNGYVVATLNSQSKDKPSRQIPNLMDGLFIFQSTMESNLRIFFRSEAYQTFLGTLGSSHISLLNRIEV